MTTPVKSARPRNAEASRNALRDAAHELFSERGFDQTTTRDIGERAGVDASLIARYFGSKLNLYLAALTAESADTASPAPMPDARAYVAWLLGRVERRGPGPLMQALIRTDTTEEIRQAVAAYVQRRLIEPLASLYESGGVADPQLHAETAVAALIGILIIRSTRSLPRLTDAPVADLETELVALIENVGAGSDPASGKPRRSRS